MHLNYRNKFLIDTKTGCYVIYRASKDKLGHKKKDPDGNQLFSPNMPMNIGNLSALCTLVFLEYPLESLMEVILEIRRLSFHSHKYIYILLDGVDLLKSKDKLLLFDGEYKLMRYPFGLVLKSRIMEDDKEKLDKNGEVVYGDYCYFKEYSDIFIYILESKFRENDSTDLDTLHEHTINTISEVINCIKIMKRGIDEKIKG